MTLKTKWRQILLAKRKAISQERRLEASLLAFEKLQNRGNLLSFTPIGSEIDIRKLNEYLLSQSKLKLVPYKIDAFFHIDLQEIDCILVPAVGFDRENTRLGYGKGYYDQFLSKAKDVHTIGIGFREQLCEELLPKDPWDIPVKELLLF